MDNLTKSPGFLGEHGFSCWIEREEKKDRPLPILFDTGASDKFLTNAARLGIDVKAAGYVLVSHGHNDHGGGLGPLLKEAPHSRVYLSDKAFEPHLKGDPGEKYFYGEKSIGLNTNLLKSKGDDTFVLLGERTAPETNIFIETNLNETYLRPANHRLCMVDSRGILVPDDFSHEIYLIILEGDDLYLFTGCAHRGITNILAMAQERYPGKRSYTAVGGFHLSKDVNDDQIQALGRLVVDSPAQWRLITGHCTGEVMFAKMKKNLPCPVFYGSAGSVFTF